MRFCRKEVMEIPMPRWGQMFLLYLLSTAGLIVSVFLLGDMTLFYEGMTIIGVILVTNIIVVTVLLER
jgi:cytochrome c oxidase subunit IV